VLLPLYPQFSTTTTQSSAEAWRGLCGSGASRTVCCYPQGDGWIEAQAEAVKAALAEPADRPVRVLFSAHGIPESWSQKKGDPYQEQIEATCAAIVAGLGSTWMASATRAGSGR
jgi:ferrochelatase